MTRQLALLAAALLAASPALAASDVSPARVVAMFGVANLECPGGVGGNLALQRVLRRAAREYGYTSDALGRQAIREIPWAHQLWAVASEAERQGLCESAWDLARP